MQRYAITDGTLGFEADANEVARLCERCAALARDGVKFVLVREKQLPAGQLLRVCRELSAAVRGSGTEVLVAGRVDVAIAAGVDGVHLSGREGELTVAQVRALMPGAFVSVACHSIAEVRAAVGADAVLFAPVFGKWVDGVEVVPGVGLEALREACAVGLPVFALGGVTEANAEACVGVGAVGVAGIRMFFAAG